MVVEKDSIKGILGILLAIIGFPILAAIVIIIWHESSLSAFEKGKSAYYQGKTEKAIIQFTRALEKPVNDTDIPNIYFLRADAYYVLGEYELALADYTAALQYGYIPTDLVYFARGNCYAALGNYKLADLDHNVPPTKTGMGAYLQYEVDQAGIYTKVIQQHPTLASAYYARGFAIVNSPWLEHKQGIKDLTMALELGQEPSSQVYLSRGHAKMYINDDEGAFDDFAQALAEDPNASDVYYYRAILYIRRHEYEEAFFDLKMLVSIDPADPKSLYRLCWRGSLMGRAAEVLFACEEAVRFSPDNADFRDSRGLARALLRDYEGAIEDFQFFIRHALATQDEIADRKFWIAELQKGRSPFSKEVLEKMLQKFW